MAWKEIRVEQQRKLFIEAYLEERYTIAELCRHFEISRPCGYKWIDRYNKEGLEGLLNRSCAPLKQSGATSPELVEKILEVKIKRHDWGPKKVRGHLIAKYPNIIWPSVNTTENILKKHGFVGPRKYRKRFPQKSDPLSHANQSNAVWSVDFKGWWITKDKYKCDPFTLTDNFSRYLLRCIKLEVNDAEHVWAILESAFHDYGLPDFMRHDNGPPFGTSGVGRLSALSVKLIKAGVTPEWIEPGEPQQNGRHERMHGTLQREGVFPNLSIEEQKKQFSIFQEYYNFERPHEALGQVTPGSVYNRSLRTWNGRLISPEYSDEYKIGKVKSCGKMSWKGREVYIGRVLAGEPLGIKETEENVMTVYYGPISLGTLTKEGELDIPRRKDRIRKKYNSNNSTPQ